MASTEAEWVLDSGMSIHVTGNKSLLADYHESADKQQMRVVFANGLITYVVGYGSLDTENMKVTNVRHADGIERNVISMDQLIREHRLEITINSGVVYIKDTGGKIVGQARTGSNGLMLDYLICVKDNADQDNRLGISGFDISEAEQGQMEWILDTSASRSVTGNRKLLRNYMESCDEPPLVMVNGHRLDILGHGSVNSASMKVSNVGYNKEATENLVSVAQFASEHSLTFVFEPKDCYILKTKSGGQLNVGRAQRRNGGYVLEYLIIGEDDDASFAAAKYKEGPDPFNIFGLSRFVSHPGPAVYSSGDYVTARALNFFSSTNSETRPLHLIMDSGASFHTVYKEEMLKIYPESLNVRSPIEGVRGVDGKTILSVVGCGYMETEMIQLDGIIYIPQSVANLISVGQMTEVYFVRVVFEKDHFSITDHFTGHNIGHGCRMKDVLNHYNHYELVRFLPRKKLRVNYSVWGTAAGPPGRNQSSGETSAMSSGPAAAPAVMPWPGTSSPRGRLPSQSQEDEAGSSSGSKV